MAFGFKLYKKLNLNKMRLKNIKSIDAKDRRKHKGGPKMLEREKQLEKLGDQYEWVPTLIRNSWTS